MRGIIHGLWKEVTHRVRMVKSEHKIAIAKSDFISYNRNRTNVRILKKKYGDCMDFGATELITV